MSSNELFSDKIPIHDLIYNKNMFARFVSLYIYDNNCCINKNKVSYLIDLAVDCDNISIIEALYNAGQEKVNAISVIDSIIKNRPDIINFIKNSGTIHFLQ